MKFLPHGAVHGAVNHGVDARGKSREQQMEKLYGRRNVYQKTKFQNRNDYKRSPTDEKTKHSSKKYARCFNLLSSYGSLAAWKSRRRDDGIGVFSDNAINSTVAKYY